MKRKRINLNERKCPVLPAKPKKEEFRVKTVQNSGWDYLFNKKGEFVGFYDAAAYRKALRRWENHILQPQKKTA